MQQIGNVGQTDATNKRDLECFGCDRCSPFGSASAMVLRLITGKRTGGPSQAKLVKPPVRHSQAPVFRATEPVMFNTRSHFMLSVRDDIRLTTSFVYLHCRCVTF